MRLPVQFTKLTSTRQNLLSRVDSSQENSHFNLLNVMFFFESLVSPSLTKKMRINL